MKKILTIAMLLIVGFASSVLYGCDRRSHVRYTGSHRTGYISRPYIHHPPVRTMRPSIMHRSPFTVYRPNPMSSRMRSRIMPYRHAPVMPHRVQPSRRLSPATPYHRMQPKFHMPFRVSPARPSMPSRVSPAKPHSSRPSMGRHHSMSRNIVPHSRTSSPNRKSNMPSNTRHKSR